MASPARTLARGHKISNLLAISLVVSLCVNIGTPVYYSLREKYRQEVVVFDVASGTLLLSPLIDPTSSKEVLNIESSWMAKAILDRSASGLDNEQLAGILFNSETRRKLQDEFSGVKQQYIAKNLRSHIEIKSIDAQPIGNGIIKSRVIGQVIITGTVNGSSVQMVDPIVLDLSLIKNPDLGNNQRYPLMCWDYSYAEPLVKK